MSDSENDAPDVLPGAVIETLSLLWIALFGGRWICVSLLQWNGILAPEQVAALDANVLSRAYVVLLALTALVLMLRVLHSRRTGAGTMQAANETPHAAAPRSRQESRDL